MSFAASLNPEKALIFRIVHIDNFEWLLDNGITARNHPRFCANYQQIGNADLIDRRSRHPVPAGPGGVLNDYVPFYFTPFSPMLYNIITGYGVPQRSKDEIIILASSLRHIHQEGMPFVFTDRHAYLQTAEYYTDLADLDKIDWDILQRRDFRTDLDDPGKKERYQAEALIHQELPIAALAGIGCYDRFVQTRIQKALDERDIMQNVVVRPGWYF